MNLVSHLKFYLLCLVKCYIGAASFVNVLMLKSQLLFSKLKKAKKIHSLTCIASEQKACITIICCEDVHNYEVDLNSKHVLKNPNQCKFILL